MSSVRQHNPLDAESGPGVNAERRYGSLPRLLVGVDGSETVSFEQHRNLHGSLPRRQPQELIEMVELSGLRGCGGARFPTGEKLRAVRNSSRLGRRPSAVVVNGSETEPRSAKDRLLLGSAPHLVIDGAILAARAVGAQEVIIKVADHGEGILGPLGDAVNARDRDQLPVSVAFSHTSYVGGEESAVMNFLSGGPSIPTFGRGLPSDKGLRNRPTLIQNAETLAHLALIARHGPEWFRELGTEEDPGSTLVTVSGHIRNAGVYEIELGTPIGQVLDMAGGPTEPLQALLLGGYFGTWSNADTVTYATPLAPGPLKRRGLSLGSGIIVAVGHSADGLAEGAAIASYLAGQSAGQCGPCVHGLAAIAQSLQNIARGTAAPGEGERLRRWCADVEGRGACHHPSGAVRFVRSTLDTFGAQVA